MSLRDYQAKRDFRRTREPAAGRKPRASAQPLFVVQKHAARRLHYDFRLEMEGVLKSWAVPKGFPARKAERRLAVQVEDHPLEYANFEGTIPEGSYGAGTVMVWDRGVYHVHGDEPLRALQRGKLHLTLEGSKLNGDWTMVRMRRSENDDKPQWLLLKSGESARPISARAEDQSVLTRRSLKQIANAGDAVWQSDRPATSARPQSTQGQKRSEPRKPAATVELKLRRLPRRKAEFIEPMKALLTERLPRGAEWIYEVKFDGVRAVTIKRGREVQLLSRTGKDMTGKYGEVTEALRGLPVKEAVLDGEVVALDAEGRPSFQLLQSSQMPGPERPAIFYYVFDVIQLDGKDLTAIPLLQRKATAQALVSNVHDRIRFSAGIQADTERMIREMKARGLEGIIAKRKDGAYEIGRRSGAWLKFKWTNEQEFVIGGYTQPRGARSHFGAILAGYYDGSRLMFAGKVGTGFDEKRLESLYKQFQKLKTSECPFANLPERAGRYGRGLTAAEMKRCTWLKPELVCQVRFAEWTRDDHLRQPAFLGLREDKKPEEVVREFPTAS